MFYRTLITQFRLNLKTTFLFQLSVAVCLFTFILFVSISSLAAESSLSKLSVAEMSSIHYQASATENFPLFLDAMVITGSRTLHPLADTPVRTLVIDYDSIQKLHSRDIRDACVCYRVFSCVKSMEKLAKKSCYKGLTAIEY